MNRYLLSTMIFFKQSQNRFIIGNFLLVFLVNSQVLDHGHDKKQIDSFLNYQRIIPWITWIFSRLKLLLISNFKSSILYIMTDHKNSSSIMSISLFSIFKIYRHCPFEFLFYIQIYSLTNIIIGRKYIHLWFLGETPSLQTSRDYTTENLMRLVSDIQIVQFSSQKAKKNSFLSEK